VIELRFQIWLNYQVTGLKIHVVCVFKDDDLNLYMHISRNSLQVITTSNFIYHNTIHQTNELGIVTSLYNIEPKTK